MRRFFCRLFGHRAPDWWDESHGRHAACTRCGERFDATGAQRLADDVADGW